MWGSGTFFALRNPENSLETSVADVVHSGA
jgi:hypothetical protein